MSKCECTDPGCPHCEGDCTKRASQHLYRRDMEDATGVVMCGKCADDAMEAGVFREATISEKIANRR